MPETVITGLFSVLSAAIGGIIGYNSAISASIRKEHNDAALEFQTIFHKTLFKIDPRYKVTGKDVFVLDILENDFEAHSLAILKFRQYIPPNGIAAFDAAWKNYHAYEITDDHHWDRHFHKYSTGSGDPRIRIDTDSIIKNINLILSFSKLKH